MNLLSLIEAQYNDSGSFWRCMKIKPEITVMSDLLTDILRILLGSGGLLRLSELTLIELHRSLQHSLAIESQASAVVRVV